MPSYGDLSEAQESNSTPARIIECCDVTDWRDSRISRISFAVHASEVYGLLGGPGAGKTSIVDLVLGLRTPSAGRVAVCEASPAVQPKLSRRLISFCDGRRGVDSLMTPIQNLQFFVRLAAAKAVPVTAATNALRQMGVADRYLHAPIAVLPPEVALATAMAVALVRGTPALVLDDPTIGLDSKATDGFIDALQLFKHRGTAVLLTTSDVLLAGQAADRIAILKAGEILVEQEQPQLRGQSLTEFAERYLGRPRSLPVIGSSQPDTLRHWSS